MGQPASNEQAQTNVPIVSKYITFEGLYKILIKDRVVATVVCQAVQFTYLFAHWWVWFLGVATLLGFVFTLND